VVPGSERLTASRSASGDPAGTYALPERGRVTVVVLCAAILALEVGYWLWFLWRALHSAVGQYDFSSYYAAASALRVDPHVNIYSPAVLARSGALGHVQVQPPLPYTYPPFFAIALIPLTVLPFHIAARVWLVANAAVWILCTLLLAVEVRHILGGAFGTAAQPTATLWRRAVADPSGAVALALCAMLCLPFAPAQQTLLTGQIDLLVLLPLAAVPWLTRHAHERWVGVAFALTAMLKLTPGVLLIYLALRKRWTALSVALMALVGLSLASIAVVGPGVFWASITQALQTGSSDASLGHNEALFASVLNQVRTSLPTLAVTVRAAAYVVEASLAVGIGVAVWRARPGFSDPLKSSAASGDAVPYAMSLCALLLVAPTAWVHHYVWVLPVAALLLGLTLAALLRASDTAERRRAMLQFGVTVLAAVAIGWLLPHEWDTQPHPVTETLYGLPLRPALLELRAIGTAALLAVALSLGARTSLVKRPQGETGA